ncbi:MAG: pyruvate carboxylase subunit A [candidate division TM6 bacterium GW2011_GWF2_38_10]|nr:MAG: pyruvate carboxylase subunit A [candidate division TM6 bacterium GW2011_GWF2_38_10]
MKLLMSMHEQANKIKKVLIVNRSEVALRIQATCKALGMSIVAVYAPQDAASLYVAQADEAYALSGHGFAAYLRQDDIIEIAKKASVDAIHPGYGFLSENADFAEKVIAAGFIWVGPSPEAIRAMGDKIKARMIAQAAGVPVIPGDFVALDQDGHLEQGLAIAKRIGFPVIIKDPLAGGGKAMRRVDGPCLFADAWRAVVSEAGRLTSSRELLIEKYLDGGRHIEIQVAGDGTDALHFFERECSVQRRHQKIVEEAPCCFVDRSVLQEMAHISVQLAKAVAYASLGTVEFMVTADGAFYFLEMNTRLQVEHSVTEMTTGVDLVALQFLIAQGCGLGYEQAAIRQTGHAIECRVYAEDPFANFAPSTGQLTHVFFAHAPWIRVDHDLCVGGQVSPLFDPMIAKITVFGANRTLAIGAMVHALQSSVIGGITTNMLFLKRLVQAPFFVQGMITTQTLQNKDILSMLTQPELLAPQDQLAALLAVMLVQERQQPEVSAAAAIKEQVEPARQQSSWWRLQQWK